VSRAEIADLLRKHSLRRFAAGDLVFSAGEGIRHLFLLLEGIVKTYVYSPRGQQQIIHVFYPGDAFGGLVFGRDQEPWAEAMTDVALICMDESELKELMQSFPEVCMNILEAMVDHHRTHVERMQTLLHKDTVVIRGGFTHQDLANMIGVVRSTVSELMSELRRLGIVSGTSREICIGRGAARRFLSDT
jgi:CRP/FNR family transcriptional regulator